MIIQSEYATWRTLCCLHFYNEKWVLIWTWEHGVYMKHAFGMAKVASGTAGEHRPHPSELHFFMFLDISMPTERGERKSIF